MTITYLAEQPAEHIITFHNAGSFYEYAKCELDAVRRRLELARVEGETFDEKDSRDNLVNCLRSLTITAAVCLQMWDEDQENPCDYCESTVDVSPIEDPWGGIHGYRCADCHEAAYDRAMEAAMEGPTYRERVSHETEQALKMKRGEV